MGNKSVGKGKYISHYFAVSCIIAALNLIACTPYQDKIAAMKVPEQLEHYRGDLAAGFFETVIRQSLQVVAENETRPPADVAFYVLGEVYAHPEFQGRDYILSQYYFERLIENFPDSELTSEAKTYISLFETIGMKEQETAAVEEKLLEVEAQKTPVKEIIVAKEKKQVSAARPRKIVVNRKFEEAVQKNLLILEKSGKKEPADEALYNLGLIYAHVDNPAKDYQKSKIYFHVLIEQFPNSKFVEEARIWFGVFETLDKIQQIDVDIEQQKKQLIR